MSTACCEDADPATKAVEPIASDGSSQQTPCRPRRRRSPGVVGTAQNRRICMWSAMRAVASLGRTKSAFRSHVRFRSALRSVIIADPWKSCTTWPTAGWDLGNLFGSGRLDVGFSGPGVVGPRPRCRTAQPLGRPAPATACARLPPASGPPLLPGNNPSLAWPACPARRIPVMRRCRSQVCLPADHRIAWYPGPDRQAPGRFDGRRGQGAADA